MKVKKSYLMKSWQDRQNSGGSWPLIFLFWGSPGTPRNLQAHARGHEGTLLPWGERGTSLSAFSSSSVASAAPAAAAAATAFFAALVALRRALYEATSASADSIVTRASFDLPSTSSSQPSLLSFVDGAAGDASLGRRRGERGLTWGNPLAPMGFS